jgi:hypothetical protein
MKRCISCGEEIYRNAALCAKCHSPQNWTRYILQWSGVGAAIAAVLPLWAGAWSLSQLAFLTRHADVAFVAFACRSTSIRIAADNRGQQAAVLLNTQLRILQGKEEDRRHFSLRFDDTKTIIEPKKTTFIDLSLQSGGADVSGMPAVQQPDKQCRYEISITTRDFEGAQVDKKVQCDCPQ